MGKITYVTCYYCGRRVPRDKAVPIYKRPSWLPPNVDVEYVGLAGEKVYVCISCAKHRGISFREWRERVVREDRRHLQKARKRALGRRKRGGRTKREEKESATRS